MDDEQLVESVIGILAESELVIPGRYGPAAGYSYAELAARIKRAAGTPECPLS